MAVIVSYEVLGGDWSKIALDVESQLPLTNLHWKSASRTIRTIQTLDLEFQPLITFSDELTPVSLLDRPYLHLLFVICDVRLSPLGLKYFGFTELMTILLAQDNEVYRATVRTQIREWLDSVISKHRQEWLVVHVTTGRSAGGKFYQRKGSVVDKIRADFNTGKRDRLVNLWKVLFVCLPISDGWFDISAVFKSPSFPRPKRMGLHQILLLGLTL